ncbi:hypothetical protein IH785_12015 [candidate division KSB1 bacterium]|nr:hypothetical protein [candidate division KSB1 bacterium]
MGQRELLLVLGALILFGLTMLSTNRYVIDQNESIIQREFEFYGISLAQSFIEEAKTKAFDEKVINGAVNAPGQLTHWNSLGPDAGETHPNFDDVDDYNGLTLTESTGRDTFDVSIEVGYILDETDPETIINSRSWYKRMNVTISNPFLIQPLVLGFVFSYLPN